MPLLKLFESNAPYPKGPGLRTGPVNGPNFGRISVHFMCTWESCIILFRINCYITCRRGGDEDAKEARNKMPSYFLLLNCLFGNLYVSYVVLSIRWAGPMVT